MIYQHPLAYLLGLEGIALPPGDALDAACGTGLTPSYRHTAGAYLRAALAAGFQVRRCEEPPRPDPVPAIDDATVGGWDEWPWSLLELVPEAARAAWAVPAVVVWHFAASA